MEETAGEQQLRTNRDGTSVRRGHPDAAEYTGGNGKDWRGGAIPPIHSRGLPKGTCVKETVCLKPLLCQCSQARQTDAFLHHWAAEKKSTGKPRGREAAHAAALRTRGYGDDCKKKRCARAHGRARRRVGRRCSRHGGSLARRRSARCAAPRRPTLATASAPRASGRRPPPLWRVLHAAGRERSQKNPTCAAPGVGMYSTVQAVGLCQRSGLATPRPPPPCARRGFTVGQS